MIVSCTVSFERQTESCCVWTTDNCYRNIQIFSHLAATTYLALMAVTGGAPEVSTSGGKTILCQATLWCNVDVQAGMCVHCVYDYQRKMKGGHVLHELCWLSRVCLLAATPRGVCCVLICVACNSDVLCYDVYESCSHTGPCGKFCELSLCALLMQRWEIGLVSTCLLSFS